MTELIRGDPGLLPFVQRKRAAPHGSELAKWQQREPVYEKAKTDGERYCNTLADRRLVYQTGQSKPTEIASKTGTAAQMLATTFEHEVDSLGEHDGEWGYFVHSLNPSDQGNFYENEYWFPSGRIVATSNLAGDNPKPPSNSDVLWFQYCKAREKHNAKPQKREQVTGSPLPAISRTNVVNEQTKQIAWMVFEKGEKRKTVMPSTDDGKALLGSPNGKSSVWMLHDRMEELGPRTIQSIDLERITKKEKTKLYMHIRL